MYDITVVDMVMADDIMVMAAVTAERLPPVSSGGIAAGAIIGSIAANSGYGYGPGYAYGPGPYAYSPGPYSPYEYDPGPYDQGPAYYGGTHNYYSPPPNRYYAPYKHWTEF